MLYRLNSYSEQSLLGSKSKKNSIMLLVNLHRVVQNSVKSVMTEHMYNKNKSSIYVAMEYLKNVLLPPTVCKRTVFITQFMLKKCYCHDKNIMQLYLLK